MKITKITDKTEKIKTSTTGFLIKKDNPVKTSAARDNQIVTSPGIIISSIANTAVAIAQNNSPIFFSFFT